MKVILILTSQNMFQNEINEKKPLNLFNLIGLKWISIKVKLPDNKLSKLFDFWLINDF